MNLRRLVCLLASGLYLLGSAVHAAEVNLSSATIADLQAAMAKGTLTSEKLVELYLARIAAYDQQGPKLNTVITLAKDALAQAKALDAERKAGHVRGPLHGVVILAKDVFDTKDMPTTGGFLPMATSQPRYDSFIIARLREAGAIVLAKLNQSDWYGVADRGASTLKGQVLSPYNPSKWPGSSSSGTGASMAAWFGTVGLGSDTGGSITIPTAQNNLVGFATTHGLVSRTGQMWSSPRQENGGPMGRSVYDCAAVLDAIAGYDPTDLATEACVGKLPDRPYISFVDTQGLKSARIGVLREMVRTGPGHAEGDALFEKAIADFKKAGAVIIDPAFTGLNLLPALADAGASKYEVAVAINKYLAALPSDAPVRTVDEMIAKGGKLVKPGIIEANKSKLNLARDPALIAAYKQQDIIRAAVVGLMEKYQLDAVILPFRTFISDNVGKPGAPTADGGNNLSSYTGLPTIVVPGGFFPSDGMPFGVQFLGKPFTEPTLIKLASGYEAVTGHRRPPAATPALSGETIIY